MTLIELRSDFDVEVVQQCGDDLMIGKAAWVSTGRVVSEPEPGKLKGTLEFLMKKRHGSPFEHGFITFRINAPIFLWREFHRHRIGFSYNEESGRYMKLKPVFYAPGEARGSNMLKAEDFKPSKPGFRGMLACDDTTRKADNRGLRGIYQDAYDLYEQRLAAGYDNGLARIDLPVALYSACYVSCNPRSLMNLLELRTDEESAAERSHPLWEFHVLAKTIEEKFSEFWPITYKLWNDNGRKAP